MVEAGDQRKRRYGVRLYLWEVAWVELRRKCLRRFTTTRETARERRLIRNMEKVY
jgi:hypothetical protein